MENCVIVTATGARMDVSTFDPAKPLQLLYMLRAKELGVENVTVHAVKKTAAEGASA